MLILTRKTNEKIKIGNEITLSIIEIKGVIISLLRYRLIALISLPNALIPNVFTNKNRNK